MLDYMMPCVTLPCHASSYSLAACPAETGALARLGSNLPCLGCAAVFCLPSLLHRDLHQAVSDMSLLLVLLVSVRKRAHQDGK